MDIQHLQQPGAAYGVRARSANRARTHQGPSQRENSWISVGCSLPMPFKLFRKPSAVRPRIEQDSALAEELARRVNAIEFQPSRGFLKDQRQPKRSTSQQLDPGDAKANNARLVGSE
jgi:hypothetical protein